MTPEAKARLNIDKMLTEAGYVIQDMSGFNRTAAPGVAVREWDGAQRAPSCGFGRQPNKQKRQKTLPRFLSVWAGCAHHALLATTNTNGDMCFTHPHRIHRFRQALLTRVACFLATPYSASEADNRRQALETYYGSKHIPLPHRLFRRRE